MTDGNELTIVDAEQNDRRHALMLTPVMDPAMALARIEEFQQFIGAYMKEGEDYGTIPGTPKPTLYKPGADKLKEVYGLYAVPEIIQQTENWDATPEFFDYTIKCTIRSKRDDSIVAVGLGSCNSYEARYKWRDKKLMCPACKLDRNADMELRRSSKDAAYYCWAKLGGCNLNYFDTPGGKMNEELLDQLPLGKQPNPDMASLKNTILKMAEKRADVDATLKATRSSGIFTQDMEDLHAAGAAVTVQAVEEAKAEDKEARKAPPAPKPPARSTGKAEAQPVQSQKPPEKSQTDSSKNMPAGSPAKTTPTPTATDTQKTTATTSALAGMAGLRSILTAATAAGITDRTEATKILLDAIPELKGADILKVLTVAQADWAAAYFQNLKKGA